MTTDVAAPLGKLALWEYGQRRLGYGDWTEDNPEPYPKWAGLQAHKLWLSMRKRRVSQDDFMLCVDYCKAHSIRIENPVWVFKHYADAKREQREQTPEQLQAHIEKAIGCERSFADSMSANWIAKLTRAQGSYRKEVLSEWELFRQIDTRSL